MKQPNKHITRLIAATLSGSILTNACINPSPLIEEELENIANLPEVGQPAIDFNFTEEEIRYFTFLSQLADDILSNPEIANTFALDPNAYLRPKGYDFSFNIAFDAELLRLIIALGDTDINEAIIYYYQ